MGIAPKPHCAWVSLRCSANEQPRAALDFLRDPGGQDELPMPRRPIRVRRGRLCPGLQDGEEAKDRQRGRAFLKKLPAHVQRVAAPEAWPRQHQLRLRTPAHV
jgi:hypothetical protein